MAAPTPAAFNAKGALNEMVSKLVARPLGRDDIIYEQQGAAQGPFEVVVWVAVLERIPALSFSSGSLKFRGGVFPRKKDAEQSAAAVAVAQLRDVMGCHVLFKHDVPPAAPHVDPVPQAVFAPPERVHPAGHAPATRAPQAAAALDLSLSHPDFYKVSPESTGPRLYHSESTGAPRSRAPTDSTNAPSAFVFQGGPPSTFRADLNSVGFPSPDPPRLAAPFSSQAASLGEDPLPVAAPSADTVPQPALSFRTAEGERASKAAAAAEQQAPRQPPTWLHPGDPAAAVLSREEDTCSPAEVQAVLDAATLDALASVVASAIAAASPAAIAADQLGASDEWADGAAEAAAADGEASHPQDVPPLPRAALRGLIADAISAVATGSDREPAFVPPLVADADLPAVPSEDEEDEEDEEATSQGEAALPAIASFFSPLAVDRGETSSPNEVPGPAEAAPRGTNAPRKPPRRPPASPDEEERSRAMPSCLRKPDVDDSLLLQSLHPHVLEVKGHPGEEKAADGDGDHTPGMDSITRVTSLALLLPSKFEFSCDLHMPNRERHCVLRPLMEDLRSFGIRDPVQLSAIAAWSRNIAGLFAVPLTPAAWLVDQQSHPLPFRICYKTGFYVPDRQFAAKPDTGFNGDPDEEEPFCLLAPFRFDEKGRARLDWPMVHWSLGVFEEKRLPDLDLGLQAPKPGQDGASHGAEAGCWLSGPEGDTETVRIEASELLVDAMELGYMGRKHVAKARRRMFAVKIRSAANCTAGVQVEASEVFHRSFRESGADTAPQEAGQIHSRLVLNPGEYFLKVDETWVMPVTRRLFDSLLTLPTVLWCAEILLSTEELRTELLELTPSVAVDGPLLRCALTHDAVPMLPTCTLPGEEAVPQQIFDARKVAGLTYERLEFLGDSLLKWASSWLSYLEAPQASEGSLHSAAQVPVCNAALREVGERLGLINRVLVRRFSRHERLSDLRHQQIVPWKTGADAVESLLAATWLSHLDHAAQLDALLGFFQHYIRPDGVREDWRKLVRARLEDDGLDDFVEDIPIPGLPPPIPPPIDSKLSFEQLEFMGDAALHAMVTQHLFRLLPSAGEGLMTSCRCWLTGNRYLARRALGHLWKEEAEPDDLSFRIQRSQGMLHCCSELPEGSSSDFLLSLEGRIADLRWVSQLQAPSGEPKQLADLYEAVVGQAILLALGDLDATWSIFKDDFDVDAQVLVELAKLAAPANEVAGIAGTSPAAAPPAQVPLPQAPAVRSPVVNGQAFGVPGPVPMSMNLTMGDAAATGQMQNPKGALSEYIMCKTKRPLGQGDLDYAAEQDNLDNWHSTLTIRCLGPQVLVFSGEPRRSKKLAQASAAEAALNALAPSPGQAPAFTPAPLPSPAPFLAPAAPPRPLL